MSQLVDGSAASRFLDEMKRAQLVSQRAWIALCIAGGLACFMFLLSGMPGEGNELAGRMATAGGALQASYKKYHDVMRPEIAPGRAKRHRVSWESLQCNAVEWNVPAGS